jgi:hypothetical protein
VQAQAVLAAAGNHILHQPEIRAIAVHTPEVDDTFPLPPETMVLAFDRVQLRLTAKAGELGSGPVKEPELSMVDHLVEAVDLHRVVAGGAVEVRMQHGWPVVQVAARIHEYVEAAPAHINVQHVELREAILDRAAPETGGSM